MNPLLYKRMLKKALRITRNQQDAEDAMSMTIISMLKAKNVIDYAAYFSKSVYHNCLYIMSDNKQYVCSPESMDTLSYTPEYRDPFTTNILIEALSTLSKGQLAVMKHVLSGEMLSTFPSNHETAKHQYLLGTRRLREYFQEAA